MSTTDPRAALALVGDPVLALGGDRLPDVTALERLANMLFRELPGGVTIAPAVLPSAPPGALPPPASSAPPSPSLRSQPVPPPSAVTATTPAPGPLASPVPVPAPPTVPEQPPPLGLASGLPNLTDLPAEVVSRT